MIHYFVHFCLPFLVFLVSPCFFLLKPWRYTALTHSEVFDLHFNCCNSLRKFFRLVFLGNSVFCLLYELCVFSSLALNPMDILHVDGSATDEQSFSVKKQHAWCGTGIETIEKLQNALHDTLVVNNENLEISSKLPSDYGSSSLEDESTGSGDSNLDPEGSNATSSKCLHKSATFPIAVKEETAPESQPENKSCMRSKSLPTANKLVSAMKGGREKEGVPPRKLSVSWAPDAYDPVPTSLSHLPKKKSRIQLKSNKKHGKSKQKSKNARGGASASKDKKQYRNSGGRTEKCLDSFSDADRVPPSNKFSAFNLLDFDDGIDIGSPDSSCANNFLEQSGGTMHCVC